MKKLMTILAVVALLTVGLMVAIPGPVSAAPGLEGTVFEDSNGDGTRDVGEPGIPYILVSNGVAVTVTDGAGAYSLPTEGYFVFITTPSDYTPTTPWYLSTQETSLDFGLAYTPGKATDEFAFVQMSDIHIDTVAERVALFQQDVAEINNIDPAFVIATGDLVSSGDTATISQATQWFDVFSTVASGFNMPLYTTVGNHDNVGINNPEVDPAEPGYNKEMYRDYLGPTYYSFDWGSYHILVLDPNQFEDGEQFYGIADQQLGWLQQDLAQRQGWPLLVFYHEQTTSWENRTEVWDLLTKHGEMAAFLGHLHHNILMMDSLSQGTPEQVTGALSGEWWNGSGLDGRPRGYRIISIDADGVSSFYKGAGEERQINITSPDAIVSGQATLTAQVYTENGAITGASYRVDGGGSIPMSIEVGGPWDTATAVWDTTQVGDGHHTITIEATDGIGTFSAERVFNVTEEDTVPLGDLVTHYEAYIGQYTNVTGVVNLAMPFAGGRTAIIMDDGTGGMIILAEDCISPPLPAAAEGDTIWARAVPIKFSWAFLESQPDFSMFAHYADLIPPELLVRDGAGNPIELRLMAPMSGADITTAPAPPDEGGGCFIATAAYGSYLDSHVETLRNFRDGYMVTNPVGSALVSAYYKLSPPVAEFIDDHPALKPVVRVGLLPAVAMSTVAVNTTSAEKVAILGSVLLVTVIVAMWPMRKSRKVRRG
jgi:Icc protein